MNEEPLSSFASYWPLSEVSSSVLSVRSGVGFKRKVDGGSGHAPWMCMGSWVRLRGDGGRGLGSNSVRPCSP